MTVGCFHDGCLCYKFCVAINLRTFQEKTVIFANSNSSKVKILGSFLTSFKGIIVSNSLLI